MSDIPKGYRELPPDDACDTPTPAAQETDEATIARLAAMEELEYERVRADEAERLGTRTTVLDKQVARARKNDNYETGESYTFDDIEPWSDPVDGAQLFDAIANTLARHMVLPAGAADAVALWVMHAHTHETATISPILGITSPTPECGKTTLLTILGALVPKPLPASNVTAAALFRAVEKWRPTLLVDEADTFLRDGDELRGVINSGHNKATAFVIRTTGDDYEPRQFMTWAPKAIALIGKLPATLESRSIHLKLRRIAPGETVEPVRGDRLGYLQPLARQAARWAADHVRELGRADPDMPATLDGRRADNWRHLFAIAELAGGDWQERAHQAAEALIAKDEGQTAAIMLLSDLRDMFRDRMVDRISSVDLVSALVQMETRPWPEWGRQGKPITPTQVARLLAGFAIAPGTIKISKDVTARGYHKDRFDDAFARYLPSEPTPQHNPQKTDKNDVSEPTPHAQAVLAQKVPKPAPTNGGVGVLAEIPPEAGYSELSDDQRGYLATLEDDAEERGALQDDGLDLPDFLRR